MTDQEVFTMVATHLLAQNEKAMSANNSFCMYRSPKGLKCALGCLIPDNEYAPELEGKTFREMQAKGLVPPALLSMNVDLIKELQAVHDQWQPERWATRLTIVAGDFGLQMPEIKRKNNE